MHKICRTTKKKNDKVMKNDIMSQLDSELAHAGEETQLSPAMLLLEQLRITPEKEPPSEASIHLHISVPL
jgi:hypothetical protein